MIIDSDNYAGAGIETLFFPGGEPHAKIPDSLKGNVLFVAKLRTWGQVGLAACVMDALIRNKKINKLDVFIPYFPGARQDRSDGLAPLTASLMSMLLYQADMHIFDPHSDVTVRLLRDPHVWMPSDLRIPIRDDVVGIIAPDEGAISRAKKYRYSFYPGVNLIQCSKSRDPVTGRIYGYQMPELEETGRYIIVDDICDGGGTFNLLAEEFVKGQFGSKSHLELFVSHGIFSKGVANIHPAIEIITTTDSWCDILFDPTGRLEIIRLDQLYSRISNG